MPSGGRPRTYVLFAVYPCTAMPFSVSHMAKATVTYLADDLDGSDADETVRFALDGKSFEIDLSKKNATALRKALKPYVTAGRAAGRKASGPRANGRRRATAFSKLSPEQKDRFRKWAKLPTARRIADERVKDWIEAGRP